VCYYISICIIGTCFAWYLSKPLDFECVIAIDDHHGRLYKKAINTMFTQEIKRWLSKLFRWWPWKKTPERVYAQAQSSLNKGAAQESIFRSTADGVAPHSAIAPHIAGQSETSQTSLSTIDEWPERVVQTSLPSIEELDPPQLPMDPASTAVDSAPQLAKPVFFAGPPTPEQKLAFLQYLVKRGIVNEGFAEEHLPEQYKKYL
jgi:hypothetical protein